MYALSVAILIGAQFASSLTLVQRNCSVGTVLPGHHFEDSNHVIAHYDNKSQTECQAACCTNKLCNGWVFTEWQTGGSFPPCMQGKPCCWLKADVQQSQIQPTANCTCGMFPSPPLPPPPPRPPGWPPKWCGVHFLADSFEGGYKYGSPQAIESLRDVADTGITHVTFSFAWYQDNVSVPGPIYPANGSTPSGQYCKNSSSPSMTDLRYIITAAHEFNLSVELRPMVDPNWDFMTNITSWRGEIGNDFSESQWDIWFASYTSYLMAMAELAQETNVEMFCVEGELNTPVFHPTNGPRWTTLVKKLRGVYKGLLVDSPTEKLGSPLFSVVDYLGTDNYNPSEADFEAWAAASKQYGKPFLLQESGSPDGDAMFYENLFQSLSDKQWWAGVMFWKWNTDPKANASYCAGTGRKYSAWPIHNAPPQEVLAKWCPVIGK
eukprot:m.5701 g.5701  ORF g.5701 m.5701 type:complete len:435 (-) comp3365_c0_seq2:207-1511(-)